MKTILVTGAGGFLAGELIKQLSNQQQYHILALTSDKEKLIDKFKDVMNLSCISVSDWQLNTVDLSEVAVVIHCAFTIKSDTEQLASSLAYTKKIFLEAKKYNIPLVVNISSRSVYGTMYEPLWKEDLIVAPITSYGKAKYESEILLEEILKDSSVQYTSLRLASLIGPEFDIRVVSKFVKSAIEDQCIQIKGGKQIFSFLDVRDASSAILSLIASDNKSWSKVYNLGHYERNSIVEVAQIVKEIAKDYLSIEVCINLDEDDTVLDVGMDCELFYKETGWMPNYTIKDTIKEIFKHILNDERSKIIFNH